MGAGRRHGQGDAAGAGLRVQLIRDGAQVQADRAGPGETMNTLDYMGLFFPFEKPEVAKRGIESLWNLSGSKDMMALAMTMRDQPMAVNMSFQRSYAERYDWLKNRFKDWAFILTTAILYYMGYDKLSPDQRNIYQQAMATLDGNTPTYHIALYDKPTIVWDFHSLLLGIQLMFSFMLADDENPLRICRNCAKVYVAKGGDQVFCGTACKKTIRCSQKWERQR